MKNVLLLLFLAFPAFGLAQISATSERTVQQALGSKTEMEANSLVKNIPIKNIGPTVMSGRVVDVAVNPKNPVEFYVGYASGGLWHTINNGTTFKPVLDHSNTQNVGDIAVDWKTGAIWVGTGENNSSRSSYPGIGILKSTNKGETWQNVGLPDSHHIGRIVINPNNPDDVVVGVTGHLYSPNKERGIYKTLDGGQTWKKTLFVNETTGIIDVAYAPDNFEIQFAASWEKDRRAWNFQESGRASGIYKSTDAGASWTKVSLPESGFPTGGNVGRIGLAVFDENTVYALLDNQSKHEKLRENNSQSDVLTKEDLKSMSIADFLKIDNKKLNEFLKTKSLHEKYSAENLKQMMRNGMAKPPELAQYLEDANAMLFDTPVIGAEVYRSDDGGKTWVKQNQDYIDDFYYSYGYYFGEIRVDANNKDKIYLGGVSLIKSDDGGKSFTAINGDNVHSDHQALWLDPNTPGHLINGNDGGLNMSYDDGANWTKLNSVPVGQFYTVNVDNQDPYHVFGGLQDNGVWEGPYNGEQNSSWHQTGHNPWKSIMGGDGMQVQIDKRNNNVVYTGFQFGNYYRIHKDNTEQKLIQPKHELGETSFRFNWQAPILLSPHNQDILYLGSNKLHRSLNQGDDWEVISPDLTQGSKKGDVAYGTLTTISESPFKFGLIYTGSDDGLVQVSKDGGGSWENLSTNIPFDSNTIKIGVSTNGLKIKTPELWVSGLVASKHQKERVYVTLNGYRWDDFTPYIYVSEDYGKTWKSISSNIPGSPVNVILEDPINENLLFIGTDNGLYASFNKGKSWEIFQNGMPNVAVHDLVIQPRAKHLIIGTHGRSIYKADIAYLQQMTPEIMNKKLHIFELENIPFSESWGNPSNNWSKPNTPGLDLAFYTSKPGSYCAKITSIGGIEVGATEIVSDKGINVLSYDLAFSKTGKSAYLKKNKTELKQAKNGKTYLPKGKYMVQLSGNGAKEQVEFEIE